tara:strand:+ start:11198 stop:12541 length:1344 start_codon:yes stop_codon:yes gene_type:complete
MKTKNNLEISQIQKTAINFQMQKSLEILQLSHSEIIEKINNELQNNPLLEPETKKEKNNILNSKFISNLKENTHNKKDVIENTLEQKKNLKDYINEQINIDLNNQEEKIIARKFLEFIDNNGYIKSEDVKEVYNKLQIENFNITFALVESTLNKIQEFEPSGIFARDLSECIEIQLKSKKIFNSKYHFLVRNLELIAKNDWNLLSKKTRLKESELIKMIKNIKSLNPKPGNIFEHQPNINIIPDVILKQNKDIYKLEVNNSALPKFNFNKKLYELIKKKKLLNREKESLENWVKSGKILLESIKKRERTLEKVTKEIIKHQKDFFKKGISHFNPLTQKQIARRTGFHESTISRCTNKKYIETPKGIYELKYFFSPGIQVKNKFKLLSNKLIKNKILNIIKKERKKIMSDKKIVIKLQTKGISISRRTVTKYRKSMNIPSSFKRRKSL